MDYAATSLARFKAKNGKLSDSEIVAFHAGEQNIFAYQSVNKLATLKYAIKNIFRR